MGVDDMGLLGDGFHWLEKELRERERERERVKFRDKIVF